jgi:hypothetical protein
MRTIKERRKYLQFLRQLAFISRTPLITSPVPANPQANCQAQESDPERGNGQLEAGLLVLADLAAAFLLVVFFVFFSIPVLAEFAFPPDFFAPVFLPGEAALSEVSFFTADLLEVEGSFSAFFSAFFLAFFSVFFSADSSVAFLGVFLTGFGVVVFSCQSQAVVGAVAFVTGFLIEVAVLLPAFSAGSSAAAFLVDAFLLVAGFFTVADFVAAGLSAADFLVVAISTSR